MIQLSYNSSGPYLVEYNEYFLSINSGVSLMRAVSIVFDFVSYFVDFVISSWISSSTKFTNFSSSSIIISLLLSSFPEE